MIISSETCTMSEKLCLQWNDFKDNITASFGTLRRDEDFADVTLACEDGKQVEAHKVILATSSPVFQKKQTRSSFTLHEREEIKGSFDYSRLSLLWRNICLSGRFGFFPCHC